jgi:hypothetical protein
MTTAEKIAAMEELWLSLQGEPDAPPPPDWHRQVLAERQSRLEHGETTLSPLEEVRERLENRYK